MRIRDLGLAGASLLVVSASALAQSAPPASVIEIPPRCCVVPARTVLAIDIVDAVSSRTSRTGDHFNFRLAEPLVIEGRVIAPAGTPGVGEVVHAARAGAMGRAGELIVAARYLQHGETRISLRSLRVGSPQGRDNSGVVNAIGLASAAALPGLSLVAFVIVGGEVRLPAGTRANAQTATEMVLAPVE